ncbi:hypothetical protein ACSW8S_20115 (plasmid) [Clostridium perfringens]
MDKKECAKVLLKDIDRLKKTWNERSCFKIAGVSNLSCSDLETIKLYAETYINNMCYGFGDLMKPMGSIKAVLDKYNIG